MEYTLTFDEKVKGWTSFHSYIPDAITRVNNKLYTIKNGEIWEHNEELNGYNNFYGEQFSSKVETIFNDATFDDKIFKTIILESLNNWRVELETNYTNSTIEKSEFNQRESKWFAYIRKNEDETDLNSVAQGIGNIISVDANLITFSQIPGGTSIGDELYQLNGNNKEKIGEISNIENSVITIETIETTPIIDYFAFSKKNSRIEGSEVRGYVMNITLIDDTAEENELFGVSTNIAKSYL